jgi:hypothetical protein
MRRVLLLSLLLLGACTADGRAVPPQAAEVAQPLPRNAVIAMRTNSWGKLLSSWRIEANGEGQYTASAAIAGGGFYDYDVINWRFSAGAEGFARIEGLLRDAERGIGECQIVMTDAPYGRIDWTRAEGPPGLFQFNYGCQSPAAQRAYRGMAQAETLIAAWARNGEQVSREEVREGRSRP